MQVPIQNHGPVQGPDHDTHGTSAGQPIQQANHGGHLYVSVNRQTGTLEFTHNRQLASTPKQVQKFMEEHGNTLGEDQINQLRHASLKGGKVIVSENLGSQSRLGRAAEKAQKCLSKVTSFVKNLGKTDSSLVKETAGQAQERSVEIPKNRLDNAFQEKMAEGGLGDQLNKLSELKANHGEMKQKLDVFLDQIAKLKNSMSKQDSPKKLSELRGQLSNLLINPEYVKLEKDVHQAGQEIAQLEGRLQGEESQASMRSILDMATVKKGDSFPEKTAKRSFSSEHEGTLKAMKALTGNEEMVKGVADAFEQKINAGGLKAKLGTLMYLKDSLQEMKEKLPTLDSNSKEAKELKDAISDTEADIGKRELQLRSKDSRKQMREALKECSIKEEDSSDLKAAKSKFAQENAGLVQQMKSLTSIQFKEDAEVRVVNVHTGDTESFSVPTNFSDRTDTLQSIKAKGYSARAEGEMTVRKHVKEHYEAKGQPVPDASVLGSAVSMEKLANESHVNYEQMANAFGNKFLDMTEKTVPIFGSIAKSGAGKVGRVLDEILNELPNDAIKNQSDLKKELQKRMQDSNVTKETVDRDLFSDLVVGGKTNYDVTLAPEFKTLTDAFKDGSWQKGEEREIHLTDFTPKDLALTLKALDYVFNDPDTQKVLEHFVPLGDSGPQQEADVATRKKEDQWESLPAQIKNKTTQLDTLNKEKAVLESEWNNQKKLYDAGSKEGKMFASQKMAEYQQKINEQNTKINSLQNEIGVMQSDLGKLSSSPELQGYITARNMEKQKESLTAKLKPKNQELDKLNKEKAVLQSEWNNQKQLYDAGSKEGKIITSQKMQEYQSKINEQNSKISALQNEIGAIQSDIDKLG